MIESHIRALYTLLNHKGYYSRVGSLDYTTKQYEDKYLFGIEEIVKYAKLYDNKRNIFIGRNRRMDDKRIDKGYCISFDLDPVRQKETASTEEQHKKALEAGRRIVQRYPGGYVASSGNGCLLVYCVPKGIDNLELHYRKEKILISELQELVKDLGVKIDGTNYSTAVVKLIGTYSTKGESVAHRCSKWVDYPTPPYKNCPSLIKRLDEIVPEESAAEKLVDINHLESSFNGDRSLADYHLVTFLKKSGVSPENALQALKSNPLGRQNERPDDQARLITKIYGSVSPSTDSIKSNYFTGLFEQDSADEQAIRTGINSVDEVLGALPRGEITTISARSGFGKSSIACTVAEHLRKEGRKVIYFSTEMERSLIMHKFVSIACNVPLASLIKKEFTEDEKTSIRGYKQVFEAHPIIICDEFQPTIELVRNEIIKHKPDVVIFDHITQVGTHFEQIAQFVRGLKELTSQENIVTLMLSMLNEPPRDKNGGNMQSLRSDVRGSQELIFLSAIFLVLNNVYETKTDFQPVQVEITKNRYGLSGLKCEINVNKKTGRFLDT